MALDFNANRVAPRTQAAAAREERPQTQFWLNIGFVAEDGTFIGLPMGLALDTMEKRQIRGSNAEWNALQSASNALLDYVLEGAKTLGAGDETIANGLTIQIKRVKSDAGEVPVNENPFLKGFGGLSFVKHEDNDDASEPQEGKRKRA